MTRVNIVGDGPGGLSAALFLAKNGHDVAVYGQDKTAMHFAHIYNYLGIPEIAGSEFQQIAKNQVESFGARLVDEEVTAVGSGDRFLVTTASGESESDYLILTEGKSPELARALGLDESDTGSISVDSNYMSSIDRLYVVGRAVRPARSQAIISAGAGAVAALDIMAREEGKDVQDWDTPPKD
jgi:thioredoxin reductase (NADPH)